MRSDLEMLRNKYHTASEEITNLRVALEEARGNSDRLHRESELVVQNVNTWVREQKYVFLLLHKYYSKVVTLLYTYIYKCITNIWGS